MTEKLIHIFKVLLDLLFPQKCVGCARKNSILCEKCLAGLCEYNSTDIPVGLNNIFAATTYEEETIKKAIKMFKYHNLKALAKPLADLIFNRTNKKILKYFGNLNNAVIIPIPLSNKKLKERGYNQAELIGQHLSNAMSVRICNSVLCKVKDTGSQVSTISRVERLKNLKGAFGTRNSKLIKNKNIILVDDITTTGATLSETARCLKRSGANKIIGLVVAKG